MFLSSLYQPKIIKDNQNVCKGFERLFYWNEYKTKSDNENMTNEYRYFFSNQTLFELIEYL